MSSFQSEARDQRTVQPASFPVLFLLNLGVGFQAHVGVGNGCDVENRLSVTKLDSSSGHWAGLNAVETYKKRVP
jgi:hypothetical protein